MKGRTRGGKISPAEWPRIRSRYLAGESLANIARDYGCTMRFVQGMLKGKTGRSGAVGAEAWVAFYGDAFPGYRIDEILRRRVAETMVMFLFSFDSALNENTRQATQDLQNPTENLLRVAARVRLALELSARNRAADPARASEPRTSGLVAEVVQLSIFIAWREWLFHGKKKLGFAEGIYKKGIAGGNLQEDDNWEPNRPIQGGPEWPSSNSIAYRCLMRRRSSPRFGAAWRNTAFHRRS
jgi:hypothetical protein